MANLDDLGCVVGMVKMRAVSTADPSEQHIPHVIDGDGPEEDYHCACELALIVASTWSMGEAPAIQPHSRGVPLAARGNGVSRRRSCALSLLR
ncbi:MAG TPA: hypothetical protein VGR35_04560 [Tepidisphaeraceae bacterium]|nr:hypothetical protein [Tepidisphaeraceae bacterium]